SCKRTAFCYRSPRIRPPLDISRRRLHRTCSAAIRPPHFHPPLPPASDFIPPSPSNRGEDSIALVIEPAMVPVPELRAISRPALTTSVPTLDRTLGSFDAGKVTLIDSGSDFVFHLTTLLCVRAVMEGHEVVFLDGGNSVDPHGMVALGKRA